MKKTHIVALFLITVLAIAAAATALNLNTFGGREKSVTLRIFHAGSLSVPLKEVAEKFEEENPGAKVDLEPSGSVLAVRKITELHKTADVLMTADYRLINDMLPKYAEFNIAFASNKMVLAYTNRSKHSEEINSDKWFEILMKKDVKYGFSNPNDDPCGYRAIMVLALAEKSYGLDLLKKLVADKSNAIVKKSGDEYFIGVPSDFAPKPGSSLVIRSKSVDLIALLEAGALDYAFEYKSVAVQHGLKYVELPPEIDLSDPGFDGEYGKIHVYLFYGTDKQKEVVGKSIVYGLTIPKCAEHKDLAIKFVNLLLSDVGKEIFERSGQPFLSDFKTYGKVPEEIRLK
ncbi:MAG: tungstate ABC transporter substrate-binding protein WtpA [Thaumarchaeota archaeon]|nr:tungstate ABC transporter substrate-binding protein WtpA [Nitrososphaerota archaeon]